MYEITLKYVDNIVMMKSSNWGPRLLTPAAILASQIPVPAHQPYPAKRAIHANTYNNVAATV